MFQTEFPFTLPRGYVDQAGDLHREGVMRLATGADEVLPLKDPRVQSNPAYLMFILLSRVVTRLGTVELMTSKVIEGLFTSDLAYLQTMYNQINGDGTRSQQVVCPHCDRAFEVEQESVGELSATPSARSARR
jgi:hypothetical protein